MRLCETGDIALRGIFLKFHVNFQRSRVCESDDQCEALCGWPRCSGCWVCIGGMHSWAVGPARESSLPYCQLRFQWVEAEVVQLQPLETKE